MPMNININLLTITDTNIVKKTDNTKKLMPEGCYTGEVKSYPVYQVRLDKLYYNPENYHIASDVASYEAKHGQGVLKKLCQAGDGEAYNKVVEGIMSNSKNTCLERDKDELLYFMTQGYTAITLSDGMILDGNFRFHKLRQQQEKEGKPLYLDTIILDKEADSELIEKLEKKIVYEGFNSYACARCNHSDISAGYWWYECMDCKYYNSYDVVDVAMAEHRAFENGEVIPDTGDEINCDRRRNLKLADIYIDFLDYIGFPGDYEFLKETGIGYIISNKHHIFSTTDCVRNDENVMFYNMIMMNVFEDEAMRKRTVSYQLDSDICEEYLVKQWDIIKELQSRYSKANVKTIEEFNAFVEGNSDIKEKTIQNLAAAHNHYYKTILQKVSITEGHIDELELSVRAHNCLFRAGIKKVSDLIKMNEDSLRKVRNLGPKSLAEVMKTIEVLKELNGMV